MMAFEVVLNGRKIALAGADDLNVLNGMVTAVGKLGSKASGTKAHPKGYDLHLSVGGLTGRQGGLPRGHVRWEEMKKVKVGDEVKGGDILGIAMETDTFEHRVMLNPDDSGTITWVAAEGEYTVTEPIAKLKMGKEEKEVTMLQRWPVRRARPGHW